MELTIRTSTEQTIGSTQADIERLRAYRSIYEQLPVNESRTRVLVLHSDSPNSASVSCSLEVMMLDPEPDKVYSALSYVWGDALVAENILVNGAAFAVTTNLALALRQIRKSFGEVLLWVDAICINQRDIPERNQQVLLMKSIYSKADRVIGWIGPDENGDSKAVKTLETLLNNAIHYPDNLDWVREMPEFLTVTGTYTTDGIKYDSNENLEQLLLFLRRPFWRRIWIIQELVLAATVRLLCGEEFTDIPEPDLFSKAVAEMTRVANGRPDSVTLQIWMRLAECMLLLRLLARLRSQPLRHKDQVSGVWQGISGFINSRILLEHHQVSDPRDHVYGLLGLFDLNVVPEYGEGVTCADVYLQAAKCCLKADHLIVLTLAGTRHGFNQADVSTYLDSPPSWVPDWRNPPPARTRMHRYPRSYAFPSRGGNPVQVIDQKWLQASAVVWDTVARTESKSGWDLKELDLIETMDSEVPDDLNYPSGISRFHAFILLWVGGYSRSKTGMCDLQLDSELFRFYAHIFYCNIAGPWTKKHGRSEISKLFRLILQRPEPTSVPRSNVESYLTRSRLLRYDMRCFHTEKGYIGFGPLATKAGDRVCVLEGHKAPVLLHSRDSHYHFVGDCDVVGIMNGEVLEAVKRAEAEITEIEIR